MAPPQEALLNVEDAARVLGISPWTLRNWVRDRQIEFVRVGRLIRFSRTALQAKISENTVPEGGIAA